MLKVHTTYLSILTQNAQQYMSLEKLLHLQEKILFWESTKNIGGL